MTTDFSYDPASFKGMEQAGWEKNAASYDGLFGSITRHAIEPLLDATAVGQGTSVLDLCCGPGYVAAAAGGPGCARHGNRLLTRDGPDSARSSFSRHISPGRRGGAQIREQQLRCGDLLIRSQPSSRSGQGASRSEPCSSAGRKDCVHDVVCSGKIKVSSARSRVRSCSRNNGCSVAARPATVSIQ